MAIFEMHYIYCIHVFVMCRVAYKMPMTLNENILRQKIHSNHEIFLLVQCYDLITLHQ